MALKTLRIFIPLIIIALLLSAACSASIETPFTSPTTASPSSVTSTTQSNTSSSNSTKTSTTLTSSTPSVPSDTGVSLLSINITPHGPVKLINGNTARLTATGVYSDGSKKDLTLLVAWLSDSLVATIEINGTVSIINTPDEAHVTASLDGVTSPSVTVYYSPPC